MESGSCDDPVIINFNPKSGPPQGGTIVTISGTNLGGVFNDIISITIGSRQCQAIEGSYIMGTEIQCTVSASGPMSSNSIVISISSSTGDKTGTSNERYMFLTLSVRSIYPVRGPRSGGTNITILGSNLNIGNTEKTRIILRESSIETKRQACSDVECGNIRYSYEVTFGKFFEATTRFMSNSLFFLLLQQNCLV